jgi:hypothetical protein
MNLRALLISICLIILPVVVFGSEPGRAPLFKIERNTNANIIQYDAQIGPDGRLLKKESTHCEARKTWLSMASF